MPLVHLFQATCQRGTVPQAIFYLAYKPVESPAGERGRVTQWKHLQQIALVMAMDVVKQLRQREEVSLVGLCIRNELNL